MLSQEIDRLLAPQERYQSLEGRTRRTGGAELCDLGYANVYGGPPPEALDAIRDSLAEARPLDLQYTPYGGSTITRRLVAERLSRSHGLGFTWRHVILTPGAMAALNLLLRSLVDEGAGGEVVLVVPCWLDYPLYVVNHGLRPVFVPLTPDRLELDVDRIAAAITPATRALIIAQPANPTGVVYTRPQLAQLAGALSVTSGGRVLWISDECHRDFVAAGRDFVSPAELYPNTAVVYSFGKAFGMQGQRIGYVAVSPGAPDSEHTAALVERLCRVTGFCTPAALMQLAVRRLLSIARDTSAIDRRRQFVVDTLAEAGYACRPPDGTYFVYPESPLPDAFEFAALLAGRGVLALPAPLFHHRGHFRLSLTAPDDRIERAVSVLKDLRTAAVSA